MSYPYNYTYPKDNSSNTVNYTGPIPINIAVDTYASGIRDAIDSRNLVRASIQRILSTSKGERVMQPRFGSTLKRMLFEPLDEYLIEDIKETITILLNEQEPRIIINNIDFSVNREQHTIRIVISYKFKQSLINDTLSFTIS